MAYSETPARGAAPVLTLGLGLAKQLRFLTVARVGRLWREKHDVLRSGVARMPTALFLLLHILLFLTKGGEVDGRSRLLLTSQTRAKNLRRIR